MNHRRKHRIHKLVQKSHETTRITNVDPLPDAVLERIYSRPERNERGLNRWVTSNEKALDELTKAESFWQAAEFDLAMAVRLNQFGYASIPTREDWIFSAPFPMIAGWSSCEEKEAVAITIDGHADLIFTHSRC